jgi:hypothetical protein
MDKRYLRAVEIGLMGGQLRCPVFQTVALLKGDGSERARRKL